MNQKSPNNKYDVIIIGAGIGGLVCGCYLAKAGKKVLIIERRANVGGCCTSFTTNGFTFDAFAHSLGGLRKNGVLDVVLRELEIKNRISIHKHDPSDIFITPHYRICFWDNLEKIIDHLKSQFPGESSNINNLMSCLAYSKGGDTVRLKNLSFSNFLDGFIQDRNLKALLSMPVLGNAGLSPSMISAFTAVKLYQEFHLDGGYYPEGGMQKFSDLFADRFEEFGGTIILSETVKKLLLTSDGRVNGVEFGKGERIASPIIISNCDATQTFNKFITDADVKKPNTHNMKVSSSVYSIFLGVDKNVISKYEDFDATVWHMFSYDIEDMYLKGCEGIFDEILWFMVFPSPDKKGVAISILAPFKDEKFWTDYKYIFFDKLFARVKERLPFLEKIDVKQKAIITPLTINRWTLNSRGAAYGWASTPSQFIVPGFTQTTFVEGLFLTGHWTTQTIGISGVAYMGRDTAKIVLSRLRK